MLFRLPFTQRLHKPIGAPAPAMRTTSNLYLAVGSGFRRQLSEIYTPSPSRKAQRLVGHLSDGQQFFVEAQKAIDRPMRPPASEVHFASLKLGSIAHASQRDEHIVQPRVALLILFFENKGVTTASPP